MYVAVKEVMNKQSQVEAVEIVYCMFYAYNGPYNVGVPPVRVKSGAHDGDWEHLTVRYVITMSLQLFSLHLSLYVDAAALLAFQTLQAEIRSPSQRYLQVAFGTVLPADSQKSTCGTRFLQPFHIYQSTSDLYHPATSIIKMWVCLEWV